MTVHYPLCLDLTGRRCVVVGGGAVASRKVAGLVASGARVTVVAPDQAPELQALARAGRIQAQERPYAEGDLADAVLAIAATDVPGVNARVAADARASGILVNVVDDPATGTFILPAVVRRGDLQIAVSTGGRSPALARRVREDLERLLPPEYPALLGLFGELRTELRNEGVQVPADRWQTAATTAVLASLRAGDCSTARALLRAHLTAVPDSVLSAQHSLPGTPVLGSEA
jgi:siroheme synthase-like protein